MDTPIRAFGSEEDDDQDVIKALAAARGLPVADNGDPAPANAATAAPVAAPAPVAAGYAARAPRAPTHEDAELTAALGKRTADAAPNVVKPKWWERALGGLTAGAMQYGRVPGALQAGQDVTMRGQIRADDEQRRTLAGDDANIAGIKQRQQDADQDFERQLQSYRAGLQGSELDETVANRKQEAEATAAERQRQQGNSDREFNRQTGRDAKADEEQTWERGFKTQAQKDTEKYQNAEVGLRGAELSISRSREKREADKDARDNSPSVARQRAAAAIEEKYSGMMDALENGDPAGKIASIQGYKAERRALAQSPVNPDTQKPWGNGEREAALQEMDAAHAERKTGVQQQTRAALGRLGIDSPDLAYNPDGSTVTRGRAAQPQQQQAAAPVAKPPKADTPLTDRETAMKYLQQAGGDKQKARELARKDGWKL